MGVRDSSGRRKEVEARRAPAVRPRRRDFAIRLAQRSLEEFFDDRCPQLAASVSYHVLFSIFPLLIVLAAVFGLVVRAIGVRADVVHAVVANLPLSSGGKSSMRSLLEGATGGLSALGLLGIVGLLWAAGGMMGALRIALNAAWEVAEARPYLRGKLVDLGLVLGAGLGAGASLAATTAVRVVSATAAEGSAFAGAGLGWLLAVLFPLVLAFGIVFGLYRFVPAATVASRHAWPPALGVAAAYVAEQNLFGLYVGHFGHYNAIYGSIGAVIAFMFFVYLTTLLFLLGAEVASELPRVRRDFELGRVEPGPPLTTQLRQFVIGLWVRRTGGPAEAQRSASGDRDGAP